MKGPHACDASGGDVRSPQVSVVMATYNRSNLLPMVLRTVQWQTFDDWELCIVGDACTDESEAVVRAIGDARVSFTNLPAPCGDQSGPNNEGLRRARGDCIAFLNHDDFWLPDHLETSLEALRRDGADLVYSSVLWIGPDGSRTITYPAKAGDDLRATVPASSWLFRRELVERFGGWKHYTQCYGAPSQQWLHRLRQEGCRLRPHATLGLVKISSSDRDRAYAKRSDDEHRALFAELSENPAAFRQRVLREARLVPWPRAERGPVKRACIFLVYALVRAMMKLGVRTEEPPWPFYGSILRGKFPRKGAAIRAARRKRGLA